MPLQSFEKDGRLCFRVRVQPRAADSKITGVADGTLQIRLTAPPVENRANLQLVAFLAKILHLKKSQISVQSGLRSRAKTVAVSGLSDKELLARLIPYIV
jgi:uncharacterized protein (TIGR00251 family)